MNVRSFNCSLSGCNFMDVPIMAGDGQIIELQAAGTDRAGNLVDGLTTKDFLVDLHPPIITEIYNESSSGTCPTYNDMLTITAMVDDVTEPVAYVNASRISMPRSFPEPLCFTR